MGICLETVISYLLFVAFFIDLGEAQNGCIDQSRCGDNGPVIRFPFRLNSQPEHCGYPGFNLSCTDANQTVLELPISVKLFVQEIHYGSQKIQFHSTSPDDCFFQGLDLSFSPFQLFEQPEDYYVLFNCSPRAEIDNQYDHLVSCLSGLTYNVYAVYSESFIGESLISCTKVHTPRGIVTLSPILLLEWWTPACGVCEMEGKRCMISTSSGSGTRCISEGIISLSIQLISTLIST